MKIKKSERDLGDEEAKLQKIISLKNMNSPKSSIALKLYKEGSSFDSITSKTDNHV